MLITPDRSCINDTPKVQATSAAIVGFNKKPSGHAVAIHRLATGGEFHFFDPSYGVYRFPTAGLLGALGYLFESAYDGHLDLYGKVKGDFTIFSHEGTCPQSVLHLPPAFSSQTAEVTKAPIRLNSYQSSETQSAKRPAQAAASAVSGQSPAVGSVKDKARMWDQKG